MVFKVRKQSESCIYIVLLMLIIRNNPVDGRTIRMSSYKDIMIPEAIVECRAACMNRFLFEMENALTGPSCHGDNNCAMCWDFCQTLFVEERHIFKSMCTNHTCVSFNSNHLIIFPLKYNV